MKTLKHAKPGETVRVVRVNGIKAVKRHIMDMGITRGTEIQVLRTAPLGDPLEINLRNFAMSIRKDDADMIEVE